MRIRQHVKREIYPGSQLPLNRQQTVIRYMDWTKFQYLVRHRSLYLTRLDRFTDEKEGTFPSFQIIEHDQWLERYDHGHIAREERAQREANKKQLYVSCWCLCEFDQHLMWAAYAPNPESVAILTTVERLECVCNAACFDYPLLDVSVVN